MAGAVAMSLLLACGEPEAAQSEGGGLAADSAAPPASPTTRRSFSAASPVFIELDIGDPPLRQRVVAYHADGTADTLRFPRARVADTSVARAVDGALVAVSVGRTDLAFEERGRVVRGRLTVRERIFSDSVRLEPGTVRAWNLGPGRYQITIRSAEGADAPRALEFGAHGMRCAPDGRDTGTIHCIAREATRLVLKHNAVRPGTESARVTLIRVP